jgi:hypothetical protein
MRYKYFLLALLTFLITELLSSLDEPALYNSIAHLILGL